MNAHLAENMHRARIQIPDDTKIGDRIPIQGFAIITSIRAPVSESFGSRGHNLNVGEPVARYQLDLLELA